MAATFDYDWFNGPPFQQQKDRARQQCAAKKFAHLKPEELADNPDYQKFVSDLEVRTLIYLRDGFSYELKDLVDMGLRSMLTFECEPVDEQYKVGSFVVSTLFEEVVRVEVFAVHPSEKPEDMPLITGFRNIPSESAPPRDESREVRGETRGEITDSTESH
ncbi:MAG: hypothetical protein JSV03_02335 [Planctomycetota bacterium]|nr:MAG: hypothetical protein JSV03_02335 [Planctomycetota bacterium]